MDEQSAMKTVRISFGKNLTEKNILGLSNCIAGIVNSQKEKSSSSA